MPELLLFPVELRRFFEEPRNCVILPAAILVPFFSLWPYFASPFVPALTATFACMEPYFLNMWYLWPGQLESLALRPLNWRRIVAVKNFTALFLTLMTFACFAVITLYFYDGKIAPATIGSAFLHCIVGGFALALFGNNYSVVSPRARIGWTLDDLAASVLALVVAGAAMIPVILLTYLIGPWPANGALIVLALVLWAGWSLSASATRLAHNIPELWASAIYS